MGGGYNIASFTALDPISWAAQDLEMFVRKHSSRVQTCVRAEATCLFKKSSAQGLGVARLTYDQNPQLSRWRRELFRLFGLSRMTMMGGTIKTILVFFGRQCGLCNLARLFCPKLQSTMLLWDMRRPLVFSCTLSCVISRC